MEKGLFAIFAESLQIFRRHTVQNYFYRRPSLFQRVLNKLILITAGGLGGALVVWILTTKPNPAAMLPETLPSFQIDLTWVEVIAEHFRNLMIATVVIVDIWVTRRYGSLLWTTRLIRVVAVGWALMVLLSSIGPIQLGQAGRHLTVEAVFNGFIPQLSVINEGFTKPFEPLFNALPDPRILLAIPLWLIVLSVIGRPSPPHTPIGEAGSMVLADRVLIDIEPRARQYEEAEPFIVPGWLEPIT